MWTRGRWFRIRGQSPPGTLPGRTCVCPAVWGAPLKSARCREKNRPNTDTHTPPPCPGWLWQRIAEENKWLHIGRWIWAPYYQQRPKWGWSRRCMKEHMQNRPWASRFLWNVSSPLASPAARRGGQRWPRRAGGDEWGHEAVWSGRWRWWPAGWGLQSAQWRRRAAHTRGQPRSEGALNLCRRSFPARDSRAPLSAGRPSSEAGAWTHPAPAALWLDETQSNSLISDLAPQPTSSSLLGLLSYSSLLSVIYPPLFISPLLLMLIPLLYDATNWLLTLKLFLDLKTSGDRNYSEEKNRWTLVGNMSWLDWGLLLIWYGEKRFCVQNGWNEGANCSSKKVFCHEYIQAAKEHKTEHLALIRIFLPIHYVLCYFFVFFTMLFWTSEGEHRCKCLTRSYFQMVVVVTYLAGNSAGMPVTSRPKSAMKHIEHVTGIRGTVLAGLNHIQIGSSVFVNDVSSS